MERTTSAVTAVAARMCVATLLLLVAFARAAPAAAAEAPELDQVATALRDRGYFVDPGVGRDEQPVAQAVRNVEGAELAVAVLRRGRDPSVAAEQLLDRVGFGTVLVVTPGGMGYHSTEHDEATLERAADASIDSLAAGDIAQGIEEFGAELAAQPPIGFGRIALIAAVVALLVLAGVALARGSRSTRRVAARRLAEARTEFQHQIDVLAETILALADRIKLGSPEAQAAYAEATREFQEASEGFASARTEADLVEFSDELDRARWQLDVAVAHLEGREPPAAPDGGAASCFFDPDHGAGVKQATLQTSAGSREVGVCDYCAAKLERGEAPTPREVTIDGRRVPAPAAPRQYGGRGYSGLDAFSILFGRGRPVPYRWGRSYGHRRLNRGWSGGFGGGIGGGGGRSFGGGGGRSFGGGGGRSFGGGGGRGF